MCCPFELNFLLCLNMVCSFRNSTYSRIKDSFFFFVNLMGKIFAQEFLITSVYIKEKLFAHHLPPNPFLTEIFSRVFIFKVSFSFSHAVQSKSCTQSENELSVPDCVSASHLGEASSAWHFSRACKLSHRPSCPTSILLPGVCLTALL